MICYYYHDAVGMSCNGSLGFFDSQSADLAPAQSAGPQSAGPGVFMFGQAAPTPDSTAPPPSLPAPTAMGFGAATPQNFNIG